MTNKQAVFLSRSFTHRDDIPTNPEWERLHDIDEHGMIISPFPLNAWNLARTALEFEFTEEELEAIGNETINRILAVTMPPVIGYTTQDMVTTIDDIPLNYGRAGDNIKYEIGTAIQKIANERLRTQGAAREVTA